MQPTLFHNPSRVPSTRDILIVIIAILFFYIVRGKVKATPEVQPWVAIQEQIDAGKREYNAIGTAMIGDCTRLHINNEKIKSAKKELYKHKKDDTEQYKLIGSGDIYEVKITETGCDIIRQ